MLEAPRPPNRAQIARRAREVDVYGAPADAERPRPSIFAVIWRRRGIVLACTVAGLIAGVVYYARATSIYASTAVVYVQDNALKMVSDQMTPGSRSQTYLFTQCQLITSTAILSETLEKPSVRNAKTLQGESNPVGVLKGSVSAVPDKFSDLIMVSMESTSPQDAATLVNAVVESYIQYQGERHKNTAVQVLDIFQKSRDAYEKTLKDTQTKMLDLKRQNPQLTFTNAAGGSLVIGQLGELSARLLQAQLRQLDIKNAVAEADVVKDDPTALRRAITQFSVSAEDDTTADPAMQSAYQAARMRLEDLRDRLGQRNDLVRSAEKQVGRFQEELQQATRDAAAGYQALLKQSLRIADARVAEAQRMMTETRASAVELNFKQAEYEQLRKDEERITRSLDLLDARMKEINVNEDVGSLTVSVLESAKPSYRPVRPLSTKVLGMALAAGLMGGVGLAMLRDLLDQRLRSSEEITALLDLPILGTVPHILTKKNQPNGRLVQSQPRGHVAECYRTIRTALSFGSGDGMANKILLFTSPAPGDGKSTCVSNLALAFAQSGRRTLLIDADCRRPTQDQIYDLADGPGLADVLSGRSKLSEAIRKTETDKLDLLPCGTIPPNPAELLDSQALLDLLGRVANEYDQVLIDSPPVVAVTDARILAASCDASVLVLRADRSTRRLAEHARDGLQSVGANLLGVIVNDVPRGKGGYGYDYYGSGSYGYRSIAATPGTSAATNGQHVENGVMSVPGSRTLDG